MKQVIIRIIIFIVLLGLLVGAIYLYNTKGNFIYDMFNKGDEKHDESSLVDNHNGVYTYKENFGKSITAFSGCTFLYQTHMILVQDDWYKVYRSTCMGTYLESEGKSKDLTYSYNEEANTYQIELNDEIYVKDKTVKEIQQKNDIVSRMDVVDLNYYKDIIKLTEFEDNLYSFKTNIAGTGKQYSLEVNPLTTRSFQLKIYYNDYREFGDTQKKSMMYYSYNAETINNLPTFKYSNNRIYVIEPKQREELYGYDLVEIGSTGIIYRLTNQFPIVINNITLNAFDNIYIKYDYPAKEYKMLISKNQTMCDPSSESDEVAYYVFGIKYDNSVNSLSRPEYEKTVYLKEGCSYFNNLKDS